MTVIVVIFFCAALGAAFARALPLVIQFAAGLAPLALAFSLFAIPADEARAHEDNSAAFHAENSPLHKAARAGDLDSVEHFLNIHATDVDGAGGKTPLHYASENGYVSIASVLIAAGADVNAKHNFGHTPLHEATRNGYTTIAAMLIAAGAVVNVATSASRRTPLHYAAWFSSAPVVSMLLKAGAKVNARDSKKGLALHYASRNMREEEALPIALALLDAGAYTHINRRTDQCLGCSSGRPATQQGGMHWSTPLHVAIQSGHSLLVSVLITAGANLSLEAQYVQYSRHAGASMSTLLVETPLGLAVRFGKTAIFSLLLAEGVNWGKACTDGHMVNPTGPEPPCFCPPETHSVLANGRCEVPSEEICGELRPPKFYDAAAHECGAVKYPCHDSAIRKDDNSGCECPPDAYAHGDPSGGSHSHIPDTAICHANHAPIVHNPGGWLDSVQADNPTLVLHFISDHDESPNQLAHAIQHSAYRAVKALIDRGANVNQKYSDDETPLHLAARKTDTPENAALVSFLLDKGANPNIRNNAGWRPLDLAYHGGNSGTWQARRKIMSALINGGANWSDECSGGAIPNENYRGAAQVAIYPQCRCPAHMSQRDSGGACECPAHSHSQVNGLCLPKDSAQVEGEIAKMQAELSRLRAALVSLNARISLSAEMPREMVEDIAEQARETAAEIDWRRANFIALGRTSEAGDAPPPVALSDTAAECRMHGGEVRIDSGSGTRICLGLDRSGTFCLVDSGDAFPCRGLFKHVRRCNDVYHRPALNAFICGERCGADETARGRGCE